MPRRQRKAKLETGANLAVYVTDRLTEGWPPEQIAGRLQPGAERGLHTVSTETISGWICRAGQKAARLWRFLTRRRACRKTRHGWASRDGIAGQTGFASPASFTRAYRRQHGESPRETRAMARW